MSFWKDAFIQTLSCRLWSWNYFFCFYFKIIFSVPSRAHLHPMQEESIRVILLSPWRIVSNLSFGLVVLFSWSEIRRVSCRRDLLRISHNRTTTMSPSHSSIISFLDTPITNTRSSQSCSSQAARTRIRKVNIEGRRPAETFLFFIELLNTSLIRQPNLMSFLFITGRSAVWLLHLLLRNHLNHFFTIHTGQMKNLRMHVWVFDFCRLIFLKLCSFQHSAN